MKFDSDIHHRRSIRLKNYDYSKNGKYFVTICTEGKQSFFGKIVEEKMILNDAGEMIEKNIQKIPENFCGVEIDIFVIMPNHIHLIISIENENWKNTITSVGAPLVGAQFSANKSTNNEEKGQAQGTAPTLNSIIGAFKSITTNEYIKNVHLGKFPSFEKRIWQRNFHENIIRDEKSLENIQEYIMNNPVLWKNDCYFV